MCEGRDEKESLTEEMMNTCGYTVRGITNRKAVETLHMTLTSSHLLSLRIYAQSLISVCSMVAKWCFPGSYLQSLEWKKKDMAQLATSVSCSTAKVEFEFSFTEPYGGCFEGSIPKGSYVL